MIVSCGTSYYSGLVGKYMFEEYAGICTEIEYASEFRYRKPILDKETAGTGPTLAALFEGHGHPFGINSWGFWCLWHKPLTSCDRKQP